MRRFHKLNIQVKDIQAGDFLQLHEEPDGIEVVEIIQDGCHYRNHCLYAMYRLALKTNFTTSNGLRRKYIWLPNSDNKDVIVWGYREVPEDCQEKKDDLRKEVNNLQSSVSEISLALNNIAKKLQ